jgi:excisionase family DNA binding protein
MRAKPGTSKASLLRGQGRMKVRNRTNFATRSIPTKREGQTPLTLVERLEAIDHGIRPLELAALLGVGKTTLYDWITAVTIPAYRHRGVVFFDPAMIAAWLRRQETQGH